MFKYSGKMIMALSKVICWIGIVAFTIIAIQSFIEANRLDYVRYESEFWEATIRGTIWLLGALLSYYFSLFLHGFGELVDRFCGNDNLSKSGIINSTEIEELKRLKERFDRGEISKEEYNEKRSLIMRK